MIIIQKSEAEAMMKQTRHYNLKTIIHGDKDIFQEQLPLTLSGSRIKSFGFSDVLGAFTIVGNISYNKKEDKMEVATNYQGYDSYNLIDRFMTKDDDPTDTQWNRTSMILMDRRVQIIASLALASIFYKSRVAGFSNTQKASNRHFWLSGFHLQEYVARNVKFVGNFQHDFQNAFEYLWLHYPYELTGHDKNIIKVTMEEGLLRKPFKLETSTH